MTKHIIHLITQQTSVHPTENAIIQGNKGITYTLLSSTIAAFATELTRCGIKSGELVPILTTRCIEGTICLLAVLATGACYVPIDAESWSNDRITSTLQKLKATVVITTTDIQVPGARVVRLKDIADLPEPEKKALLGYTSFEDCNTDHLAYIIFTSGTSGTPRGVMISTGALLHYVQQKPFNLGVRTGDRVLLLLSISFDACSCVILSTLCNGGTLFLSSPTTFIEDCKQCTILPTTPSLLRTLQNPGLFPDLRSVFLGGEPPDGDLVKSWAIGGRKIYNSYGATETTCTSLMAELHAGQPITLGSPIAGSDLVILNKGLERCSRGQLAISGKGLAVGYFADDATTKERFIQWDKRRFYLTGDVVEQMPHGLVYRGRQDSLVKNRGYLIHTGDVTTAVLGHPTIKEAEALIHQDRLIAFVTPESADGAQVRMWLAARCETCLVPDEIRSLNSLPLTANGKVDSGFLRHELEKQTLSRINGAKVGTTNIHDILKTAISDSLHIEIDHVHTNRTFWELGGNSLAAIKFVSHLHRNNLVLTMAQLFGSSTIDDLGTILQAVSNWTSLDGKSTPYIVKNQTIAATTQQLSMIRSSIQVPPLAHIFVRIRIKHGPSVFDQRAFEEAWRSALSHHTVFSSHVDLKLGTQTFSTTTLNWAVTHVTEGESYSVTLKRIEQHEVQAASEAAQSEVVLPRSAFRLVTSPGKDSTLFWTIHHALIDGWSVGVIFENVKAALSQQQLVPAPSFQSYCLALEYTIAKNRNDSVAFWEQLLQPIVGRTQSLKIYNSVVPKSSILRSFESLSLGISREEMVQESRKLYASHAAVIYTAWALLLGNYTSSQHVIFGAVVTGRTIPMIGVDQVVGPLINICPFPVNLKDHTESLNLVKYVHSTHLAMSDFQWGVGDLVRDIFPTKGPLFDSIVAIECDMPDVIRKASLGGFDCEISRTDYPEFKLTLFIELGNDGTLVARVVYDPCLFSAPIIRQILSHFKNLVFLCLNTDDEKQSVYGVANTMMTKDEVKQLVTGQSTEDSHNSKKNVVAAFDNICRTYGTQIALEGSEHVLSYAELHYKTQLVASALSKRVQPRDAVAVLSESSFDWVIAMLGVLRVGAVYVPIDVALPQSRKENMLKRSKASLCITMCNTANTILISDTPLVSLDSLMRAGSVGLSSPHILPDQGAYLIFTSGTTGDPKPVICTHGALISYLSYPAARLFARPGRRHAQMYSVGFDVSIAEILGTLCFGATLILKRRENPYLHLENAQAAMFTPSFLSAWSPDQIGTLDTVMLAGETVSQALANKWSSKISLYNGYGPCECTIISTIKHLQPGSNVTIGKAVPGMNLYILDHRLMPVPIGVSGEIYLSGVQVANDYFGQHDPSPNFTADPFNTNRRMYRTGDLGAWTQDLEVMFLGRIDHQVKIRGFRVELEEVEAEMMASDSTISLVGVVVCEDGQSLHGALSPSDTDVTAVTKYLKSTLPPHAVPTTIKAFETLPMTPNQKLDRVALRRLMQSSNVLRRSLADEQLTGTMLLVSDAFAHVLRLSKGTVFRSNDNFVELGGHSLRQLRLAQHLSQRLDVRLPLTLILQNRTVSDLAEAIDQYIQTLNPDPSFLASIPTLKETRELSPLESELYILHNSSTKPSALNLGVEVYFEGRVNANILASAINHALERHWIFRTQYIASENSGPPQRRLTANSVEVARLPPMHKGSLNQQSVISEPFNLAEDLLLCAELVDESSRFILLLKLHHIISDKESITILLRDIVQAYVQMSDNIDSQLAKPNQSPHYSSWASWISMQPHVIPMPVRNFWIRQLSSVPPLPFSTSQTHTGGHGTSIQFTVPMIDIEQGLESLLGAVALAIHGIRETDDLVIAVSHMDRSEPGTENIAGCFLDSVPVRLSLNSGVLVSRSSLLDHVKGRLGDALSHIVPLSAIERMVEKGDVPLFDVMVSYLRPEEDSAIQQAMNDRGIRVWTRYFRDKNAALFPLLVEAIEKDRCLLCNITYKSQLLTNKEIELIEKGIVEFLLGTD
ncbi:acetyl-CoA synthetase-like protein [Pleomassaria siparia CBS 279.74]|uniref:Acetyl-CoA synthetase-like protein n=1 Tax=Pleomassaria siparia CBS 279.74 TaxID=1314801 RepID=A0A6G1KFY7_9PLEO|nr:acetyl-CoA synthetase-like protein [Pleomassaria siparia CBS 279.74]